MLNSKSSKLVQVQEYHYLARNEHIAFRHVTFLYTLCDDSGCCLHRKHVHLGFLYSKCNNTRKEKSKKSNTFFVFRFPNMWEEENLCISREVVFHCGKLPSTGLWCMFQNDALTPHCSNSQSISCCRASRTSMDCKWS